MASVGELLARLTKAASQTPPEGSRTLSVCGLVCGTLVPRSYEVLRSPAFYNVFEPISRGLALGTAAHAIGTAKALEMGEIEGAMSSLSIAVAGLLTVVFASFYAMVY